MFMIASIVYILNGRSGGMVMGAAVLRHKHLQLDQRKLDRAKCVLGAKTETEAIERALTLVVDETELDKALKLAKGRTRIRKVFR
jgi:hypothetical protein